MISNATPKRILLVDDDPVLLRMLDSKLQENGYNVIVATEADSGLQAAIKNPPDLIILDVMMPVINGYNFCQILKTEITDIYVPIIFLTSRANEEDMKIGYEMGAEGYLTKPVDMLLLLEKIKELLEKEI